MSNLTLSIDGGPQLPAEGVVIFQNGIPVAVAKAHGEVVIYVDAAREPQELTMMLSSMGYSEKPEHRLIGKLQGVL